MTPSPPPGETVTVPRALFEQLEFEVHLLRSMLGASWLNMEATAKRAKDARDHYYAEMQRAMRDPEYRRVTHSTSIGNWYLPDDDSAPAPPGCGSLTSDIPAA